VHRIPLCLRFPKTTQHPPCLHRANRSCRKSHHLMVRFWIFLAKPEASLRKFNSKTSAKSKSDNNFWLRSYHRSVSSVPMFPYRPSLLPEGNGDFLHPVIKSAVRVKFFYSEQFSDTLPEFLPSIPFQIVTISVLKPPYFLLLVKRTINSPISRHQVRTSLYEFTYSTQKFSINNSLQCRPQIFAPIGSHCSNNSANN
jgi:hypothetical protein